MTIQNVSQGVVQGALRTDFGDAGLGRVGNLAFRAEAGGTPRASKPGIMQRIGAGISNAIAYIRSSPQQRVQKEVLDAARDVSRRGADVLGALTARPGNAADQQRSAAKLAKLVQSLAALPGDGVANAGPALQRHVQALNVQDLSAMRAGALGDPAERAAVLNQIEAGPLRDQAAALLDGIAGKVEAEIADRAVGAPVRDIVTALRAHPMDMDGLKQGLDGSAQGVGLLKPADRSRPDFLAGCMQDLSDAQLGILLRHLTANNVAAMNFGQGVAPMQGQAYAGMMGDLQTAAANVAQQRVDALTDQAAGKLEAGIDGGASVESLHHEMSGMIGARAAALGQDASLVMLQALAKADARSAHYFIGKLEVDDLGRLQGALPQLGGAEAGRLGIAIEARRDQLEQPLRDRVETLCGQLEGVSDEGDVSAIAMGLAELNEAVDACAVVQGKLGLAMPDELADRLRTEVGDAMDALRADSNPDGPLTRDSLGGLADREFGAVRQARGRLADYGLRLDSQAIRDEVGVRTAGVQAQGVRETADLLRAMGRGDATAREVVSALHRASGLAVAQMDLRAALGQEVGADDRGNIAEALVRGALAQILQQDGDAAVQRVVEGFADHGATLSEALPEMMVGVASLSATDDEQVHTALEQLAADLSVGSYMLTAMTQGLQEEAQRLDIEMPQGGPQAPLPDDLRVALREAFGVDLAPTGEATPLLSDTARGHLVRFLEEPIDVGVHRTDQVDLPVADGTRTFAVSHTFNVDAVERIGTSFTVRGQGVDGLPVGERRLQPGMTPEDRAPLLGPSLAALEGVAGSAAEALTRIVNQQAAGAIAQALMLMGNDSPLKLPDGTAFMPGGAGLVHGDIERLPTGEFKISMSVMYQGIASGTGFTSDGSVVAVQVDPATSHARVSYGLLVSPDGAAFRVVDMPRIQARLDPVQA